MNRWFTTSKTWCDCGHHIATLRHAEAIEPHSCCRTRESSSLLELAWFLKESRFQTKIASTSLRFWISRFDHCLTPPPKGRRSGVGVLELPKRAVINLPLGSWPVREVTSGCDPTQCIFGWEQSQSLKASSFLVSEQWQRRTFRPEKKMCFNWFVMASPTVRLVSAFTLQKVQREAMFAQWFKNWMQGIALNVPQ